MDFMSRFISVRCSRITTCLKDNLAFQNGSAIHSTNKIHVEILNGGIIVMFHVEINVAHEQGNWIVFIFKSAHFYLFISSKFLKNPLWSRRVTLSPLTGGNWGS